MSLVSLHRLEINTVSNLLFFSSIVLLLVLYCCSCFWEQRFFSFIRVAINNSNYHLIQYKYSSQMYPFFCLAGIRHSNQLHQSNEGSAGGEDRWWGRGKESRERETLPATPVTRPFSDLNCCIWAPWTSQLMISICLFTVCCVYLSTGSVSARACGWDLFTLTWLASHIFASACRLSAFCQNMCQSWLHHVFPV